MCLSLTKPYLKTWVPWLLDQALHDNPQRLLGVDLNETGDSIKEKHTL
jgi:hypothetical protein